MLQRHWVLERILKRYEKKQKSALEDKEESYYFREADPDGGENTVDEEKEEYEILEREIAPRKIKCPDCGGVTLEGLEFCDKCGGELNHLE